MNKNDLILKYIDRIKIDYPEDDKIYGDLSKFLYEYEIMGLGRKDLKPELVEFLYNKIQGCKELGGMEREIWAFQQCMIAIDKVVNNL